MEVEAQHQQCQHHRCNSLGTNKQTENMYWNALEECAKCIKVNKSSLLSQNALQTKNIWTQLTRAIQLALNHTNVGLK